MDEFGEAISGLLSDVPWFIVLAGLEFPALLALSDCWHRPEHHFVGGAPDKASWKRWMILAVLTVPVLLGFGLLVAYYHVVVRRNSPFGSR